MRNQIRNGDKCNLSIRWGGASLLSDSYWVFCVNMRDLGTPVYPQGRFTRILTYFDVWADMAVADYREQRIAGAMLFHGDQCSQVPSASSLRSFHSTCANMWLYYRFLRRSMERGSRQFDFGCSSEGWGTHRFKKQWGAGPQRTVWQYHVRRGAISDLRPGKPAQPQARGHVCGSRA